MIAWRRLLSGLLAVAGALPLPAAAFSFPPPVETALLAAAIHVIYDPLAPNWEIEESRIAEDTYRFSLRMKRFHTGGSGESLQALKRRASQLRYEHGYAEYLILEYSEGIDSRTLGTQRVAEGVIRLVRRQEADSFRLNDGY
jgi:hypothetical protein